MSAVFDQFIQDASVRAKALICDEHQAFSYTDVILPDTGPQDILVRTLYSGVSIGTEFALIRNKLSWGPYPLCTGYQAVGIVQEVGREITRFKVGDKVYYRDNKRIRLPDAREVSAVAGTHCSHALINVPTTRGVEHLPEGVADDVASLFAMPAIGLHGVNTARVSMGDTVVVHGVGLVGLGNVAACSHRGAVVIAVDLDSARLQVARALGADYVIDASTQDVQEEAEKLAPGGADVVFETTGIPACVDTALALCREFGKFVFQGNYGQAPLAFNFQVSHVKQVTAFFPCDDGLEPGRRAGLKNIALGVLPWHLTITHRVDAGDSAEFYRAINEGEATDVLGAVIRWS